MKDRLNYRSLNPIGDRQLWHVTVEDCLENVDNRFELVMLASRRARRLSPGQRAHGRAGKRQADRTGPARNR